MPKLTKNQVKIFFLFLLFFFSILIIITIYYFNNIRYQEYLDNITSRYTKAYTNAYFEKKQLSKVLTTGLIRMGKISKRLAEIKNNKTIDKNLIREQMYQDLFVRYKELTTMGVDQLHIHLTNNQSFLRMHKPSVFGDDLTKIRSTVAYVNKYLIPIDSMEEGRIYFGLRFVYPIFYKGEHVGSVEISYSISSIVHSIMMQYDVLSNFFINKNIAKKKNFHNIDNNYVNSYFTNYYCDKRILFLLQQKTHQNLNFFKPAMYTIKKIQKVAIQEQPSSFYDEKTKTVITIVPIINKLSQESIAFLTIQSKAHYPVDYLFIVYTLSLGLLFLGLYLFYTLVNKKYELEIAVNKKTQEQKNLLALFDQGDIVLFRWNNDLQWSIDFVSENTHKLLGYSKKDFLSKKIVYNEIIYPQDLDTVVKEVKEAINQNKTFFIHKPYRVIIEDGSVKWVLDHTLLVRDEQNNVTHFLGYIIDITVMKEQENILQIKIDEALKKNIKQLEVLQQQSKMASMGEMIGAIAHQWRQPLNIISTSIQNLKYDYKEGALEKEQYIFEFINKNKKIINFMSKTIDDFRNFFRIDKEKISFDVKQTTQIVINMLKAQLNNNNISITIEGKEFSYYGLSSEYQQVILNLINNARDVLIQRKIQAPKITIKLENQMIIISDNGGGIDQKIIKRIFEPYFTTKEQGKGTGMGLYMSKMIIEENMNAKLEVKNTNDGAMFIINFTSKELL